MSDADLVMWLAIIGFSIVSWYLGYEHGYSKGEKLGYEKGVRVLPDILKMIADSYPGPYHSEDEKKVVE